MSWSNEPTSDMNEFFDIVRAGDFERLGSGSSEMVTWRNERYRIKDTHRMINRFTKHFGLSKWDELRKMSFLDICCGSNDRETDGFFPWFTVILGLIGCENVWGIDKGRQPSIATGIYQHLQLDLTDHLEFGLAEANGLRGRRFDGIVCTNTFISAPSPALERSVDHASTTIVRVKNMVISSAGEMLNNGGLFLIDQ